MAEGFLRQRSAGLGEPVQVGSAGFLAEGMAPPPEAVAAMAAYGIDTSAHRSRVCSEADLAGADLVVAMARSHVREAVVLSPAVWARTFTLKELVRKAAVVGERAPGQTVAAWLEGVGDGRQRADLLGSSDDDDVADPIGGPPAAFEATARELSGLVARMAGSIWPAGGGPTSGAGGR